MKTICFFVLLSLSKLCFSALVKARNRQTPTTTAVTVNQQPSGTTTGALSAYCYLDSNGTVYDLNGLNNANLDYKVTDTLGNVIDFNFCTNAINSCPGLTGMASYTSTVAGATQCTELAGPSTINSNYQIISDPIQNTTVVRMIMPDGQVCPSNTTRNYVTTFDITCNPNATSAQVTGNNFNINNCDNTIFITSNAACPLLNVYAVYNSILANKFIFGPIVMLFGIFFCYFGNKFIKVTECLTIGAAIAVALMWLILSNFSMPFESWHFWIVIIGSIGVGVIIALFLSHIQWIPKASMGALGGFVAGMFVYNLALSYIQSNPTVVFWCTMIVCIVIGVLLGLWLGKPVIAVGSAVVGAYAIMRGLSFMVGNFPDERQVYELGQQGEWQQVEAMLTPWVYAYLSFFALNLIAGLVIQCKYFYDDDKEKKNDAPPQDEKSNLLSSTNNQNAQ